MSITAKERNSKAIALIDLKAKKEKIYISCLCFKKHKEKQEGKHQAKSEEHWWHYLAVKILSALLRAVTSKNNGDFYCLNCLHSFRTKNLNCIKKYVKIKIF